MCPVYSINVFSMLSPWPYSDIRSCCRQSLHAFTSRYDSTLLGRTFLHQRCFCIRYSLHVTFLLVWRRYKSGLSSRGIYVHYSKKVISLFQYKQYNMWILMSTHLQWTLQIIFITFTKFIFTGACITELHTHTKHYLVQAKQHKYKRVINH